MPALSYQIAAAVAAQLEAMFPGTPVNMRRGNKTMPAYMPGDPLPGFMVTSDEEQHQKLGTALKSFCEYVVTVHYLTAEPPGSTTKVDTDVMRAIQEPVRKAFTFAGWAPVPEVNRCVAQVQKAYDNPFEAKNICDSAVKLVFQTFELRN